jgi:hypothetical protein
MDEGKLGYGFTSADELEEVDIGPGDKPRPTFISKNLNPELRDNTAERIYGLFCLGLHRDARVG